MMLVVVVTRRRRPNSAVAWLVVIFFQPWVGLIIYLLIGEYRLPKHRIAHRSHLLEKLKTVNHRFKELPHSIHSQLEQSQMAAVKLAERLGGMPIVSGNDVELMTQDGDVIHRLIADIDEACYHVHLLFYIYADDETGERVTNALARAVKRGVKCRVLVDAVGSRKMIKRLGKRMQQQGIEVRPALPVNLFRRQIARIDLRNHRKLAVIDAHIAYTGSQNIVNANYGHRELIWHDMMVRLTGPVVLDLQRVFVEDWYFETGEALDTYDILSAPSVTGTVAVQALPSGPNYPTENYQRMVVAALHDAQKHVIITTPYFVPDEAFMQAIEVAVLSGVEVELILPRRCDQPLVGAASRSYYEDLLNAGVKLYLYEDGLLHAKTMSIDNSFALIGSSNFDIRSFALNFEISLVFYGSQIVEKLRTEQNRYIENSVQLTHEVWNQRSKVKKFLHNVAQLLSPLL